MKSFIIIFAICLTYCSLNVQSQTVIDLKNKIGKNYDNILCSDIFSEIEYVQLETLPNNLIDKKIKISLVDNFILVTDLNSQYLFNSKNGKFITQIGRKGKGPGEYRSVIALSDNKQKRVYSLGWNADFIEYDFNGNYLGNIKIPGYVDNFLSPSIPGNYFMFEDNFVCYYMNCIGIETKLISFFNRKGKVLSTMKNYNQLAKQNFTLSINESVFYRYNNRLYFNEIYNDTIFELTPEYKKAQYIIDAGKYRLSYMEKWKESSEKWQNYILNTNIMESENYLFLTYYIKNGLQLCVFDKKMKKLFITNELHNDLDHFLNFIPLCVVNDNQLVGVIDAYKAAEWFNNNNNNNNSLSPNIKKLSNINISDNPIIVIAKLK